MPTAISQLWEHVRTTAAEVNCGVYLLYDDAAKSYDIVVYPKLKDTRNIAALKAAIEKEPYTTLKKNANTARQQPAVQEQEQAEAERLSAIFDYSARTDYRIALGLALTEVNMHRGDEGKAHIEFDDEFKLLSPTGDPEAAKQFEAAKATIQIRPTYKENLPLRQAAQNKALLETPIPAVPTETPTVTPKSKKEKAPGLLNQLQRARQAPKSKVTGISTGGDDEVELSEVGSADPTDEATATSTPVAGKLEMARSERQPVAGKLTIPEKQPADENSGKLEIPKGKPKPFPASPYPAGSHNLRVITWTRSYYGLGESHNWYPLTFAKARTVQTDSKEFMKFFGQFLSEINTQRGNIQVPSKADLEAALYDIQNTQIVYPYNSLKEVLLRSHGPDGTERPESLYDYIHWIRLNQFARNSFPFGQEAEDSEYISTRLNKLGWGSRPRAEMESSLQNAILFYGVDMRKDDDKGNYTITQKDANGAVRDIIKARVAEKEKDGRAGMVTFELQPGIDDKDKESAIRKMLIMHESHIQQNCSNWFEAKLGSNIYDNIRMLQLALYDFNFNVTFKDLNPDQAQQKMFAQIDRLRLAPDEAQKLKDEVLFLVSNAQTFDTTITHGGSKEILQLSYANPKKITLTPKQRQIAEDNKDRIPPEVVESLEALEPLTILTPTQISVARSLGIALEPLSLSKTQDLLLARSAKVVNTIFPGPEKPVAPTTAPTETKDGLLKSFAKATVAATANKLRI